MNITKKIIALESKCTTHLSKYLCELQTALKFHLILISSTNKINQTEVIKYNCLCGNSFHGNLFLIHCNTICLCLLDQVFNFNMTNTRYEFENISNGFCYSQISLCEFCYSQNNKLLNAVELLNLILHSWWFSPLQVIYC